MSNRLYVGNLPPGANESNLRELFSQAGAVTEVELVIDASTGLSRGRAFVTMATPELAQTALKALHSHSLGGRNITVTLARPVEAAPTGLIGHGFETGMIATHPAPSKVKPQHRYRPRHKKRKTRVSNVGPRAR